MLSNDYDPNGCLITAHIAEPPVHASAFVLSADSMFIRQFEEGFTYYVSDGVKSSVPATVRITHSQQ